MLVPGRRLKVFLYSSSIDMRSGFERLSSFIRDGMGHDLQSGHFYLFLGKNRRRAKVLYFDGTGLILVHKRLETGRFMKVTDLQTTGEMTTVELALLLEGTRLKLPLSPVCYSKKEEKSEVIV